MIEEDGTFLVGSRGVSLRLNSFDVLVVTFITYLFLFLYLEMLRQNQGPGCGA